MRSRSKVAAAVAYMISCVSGEVVLQLRVTTRDFVGLKLTFEAARCGVGAVARGGEPLRHRVRVR